jgi:hypothetical protein
VGFISSYAIGFVVLFDVVWLLPARAAVGRQIFLADCVETATKQAASRKSTKPARKHIFPATWMLLYIAFNCLPRRKIVRGDKPRRDWRSSCGSVMGTSNKASGLLPNW